MSKESQKEPVRKDDPNETSQQDLPTPGLQPEHDRTINNPHGEEPAKWE